MNTKRPATPIALLLIAFSFAKELPKGCVYCSPLHYCHVAWRASPSVAIVLCPLNFNYRPQSDFLLQRAAQKSFCLISGSQSPFPKVVSIIISLSDRCHFVAWRAECRQEIWVIFTHWGQSHDRDQHDSFSVSNCCQSVWTFSNLK